MTLAEKVKAEFHGQRGGVRKLAKQTDRLVRIKRISEYGPALTKFFFRDGSVLLAIGRGQGHFLEVET